LAPARPLPIPVARMPRIRLSDGRYMRPPLTLKAARAMATRTPRNGGTTAQLVPTSGQPPPPPPSTPIQTPALPIPSKHSRRRRPLTNPLTFPRVLLPRFEGETPPPTLSHR
ncbi:hypothetical protein PFISCL1PPCAC_4016, partial [Pristionchus fissidentatus]